MIYCKYCKRAIDQGKYCFECISDREFHLNQKLNSFIDSELDILNFEIRFFWIMTFHIQRTRKIKNFVNYEINILKSDSDFLRLNKLFLNRWYGRASNVNLGNINPGFRFRFPDDPNLNITVDTDSIQFDSANFEQNLNDFPIETSILTPNSQYSDLDDSAYLPLLDSDSDFLFSPVTNLDQNNHDYAQIDINFQRSEHNYQFSFRIKHRSKFRLFFNKIKFIFDKFICYFFGHKFKRIEDYRYYCSRCFKEIFKTTIQVSGVDNISLTQHNIVLFDNPPSLTEQVQYSDFNSQYPSNHVIHGIASQGRSQNLITLNRILNERLVMEDMINDEIRSIEADFDDN